MNRLFANKQLGAILISAVITLRLVAIPLLIYTYLQGMILWALEIFLIAVLTDALDGQIGRWFGVSPLMGPYADATIDFLLVLTAYWTFVLTGILPSWILLIIITMFAQFVVTSRKEHPIYDPVGKYYGVFCFGTIALILVMPIPLVSYAVQAGLLGFTIASITSRVVFFLGQSKKPAFSHDNAGA